jgi:hypothetical protein
MLKWEETDPHVMISLCDINWGILNKNGTQLYLLAQIHIDGALMFVTDRAHMETVLVAAIEAMFAVMGKLDTEVRQCPLTMDKWLE